VGLNFEWDERKAISNRRKHGVSFDEAASAFGDPFRSRFQIRTTPKTRNASSSSESRCMVGWWLWSTPSGAMIFV
jgi:uncharacterized DUF497 family protein